MRPIVPTATGTGAATGAAAGDIGNVASMAVAAARSFLAATDCKRSFDKDDVADARRELVAKVFWGDDDGDGDDDDNDEDADVSAGGDEEVEDADDDDADDDDDDASNSCRMSAAPDSRFRRGTQEDFEFE